MQHSQRAWRRPIPAGLGELTPPSRRPPRGGKEAQRAPEVVPRAEWRPVGAREQTVVTALKAGTTDFASMLAAFVSAPPPPPPPPRPPMPASRPQPVQPSCGSWCVPPPPRPHDRMAGSLGASCSSSCDGRSNSASSHSTAAPPAAASRASPAAGCGLRNVSAASKGCAAAVSAALRSPLLDDYIAE